MSDQQRLDELEGQIEELKRSLPAHSIPTAMLLNLEDMEEELERLRNAQQATHIKRWLSGIRKPRYRKDLRIYAF